MNSQMAGAELWTTISLILIAIGAVLAVMVIVWGARLKRQRNRTEGALEDRAEEADAETGAPEARPVAPERLAEAPRPAAPLAATLDQMPMRAPETEPLPVAPAPPPLADTPVVATPAPAPASPLAEADDLTRMKGVGPKLAARLNELGITHFSEIAALSPDDAAALDSQLGAFQGRITRDRWIEQAGYLARDDRAGFEAAFGKL